ncbi:hypothetical protein [Ralstonia phage RSF1]|uniref:Uncharacterized protein n=1 Tax=Ralstonia phage RSF1 TaxID=1689679 RepID=A0A0K2QQM7_9CAUD|nr:hypothetical protein AVU11_agp23 [Ralstonia phage RSF1]BAS04894.2 hypothetical protein [Ralstonia phage RSF1]
MIHTANGDYSCRIEREICFRRLGTNSFLNTIEKETISITCSTTCHMEPCSSRHRSIGLYNVKEIRSGLTIADTKPEIRSTINVEVCIETTPCTHPHIQEPTVVVRDCWQVAIGLEGIVLKTRHEIRIARIVVIQTSRALRAVKQTRRTAVLGRQTVIDCGLGKNRFRGSATAGIDEVLAARCSLIFQLKNTVSTALLFIEE